MYYENEGTCTYMYFLPLKFSQYPSRSVPVPELFGKYPTRPVPKSKTPTRQTLKEGSREERQSLAAGVIQAGSGAGGSMVGRQPSWKSRSGLRRRIVRGYFDARMPTSNQPQYYSPGNLYTSVDRVDSKNRRQLDILSGLGGILGGLPGEFFFHSNHIII